MASRNCGGRDSICIHGLSKRNRAFFFKIFFCKLTTSYNLSPAKYSHALSVQAANVYFSSGTHFAGWCIGLIANFLLSLVLSEMSDLSECISVLGTKESLQRPNLEGRVVGGQQSPRALLKIHVHRAVCEQVSCHCCSFQILFFHHSGLFLHSAFLRLCMTSK
jgi:hypothetical protein